MVDELRESHESARLQALRLYRVLDTAGERTFDELAELAAAICDTPISLISLVDGDRQWFKSRVGLEVRETPRCMAFCAHAIETDAVLVVPDARLDPRFVDNPLVTGEPHIRLYAGTPLIVDGGHRLGTLCVIDRRPRSLTASQIRGLQVLSRAVVTQLELRRARLDIESLSQVLPVCAWCRSVRAGDGVWESPERYLMDTVSVSHGICPQCADMQPDPAAS
ncbi:MAG: diguanylate cyclase [Gammaproteobacteria bacterium]|nr:diguanylate cyclase [Gammaproteobacteria bacterium]|tara:strand:+ start:341 stop:1006 length:666 start_codon:yes stop_codon:yes gene_type:complete